MYSEKLIDATRRLPPTMDDGSALQAAVSAGASTAALATSVATQGPGMYSLSCGAAFNVTFDDDSTITDPTDNGCFPAGLYDFYLNARHTHFKLTFNAAGSYRFWKSGLAKR